MKKLVDFWSENRFAIRMIFFVYISAFVILTRSISPAEEAALSSIRTLFNYSVGAYFAVSILVILLSARMEKEDPDSLDIDVEYKPNHVRTWFYIICAIVVLPISLASVFGTFSPKETYTKIVVALGNDFNYVFMAVGLIVLLWITLGVLSYRQDTHERK